MDGTPFRFQNLACNLEFSNLNTTQVGSKYPPIQGVDWTAGNDYSQTSMTPMGETLERKHGYTSRHGPGGRLLELSNINTTPVGSKYPPVQGVDWTPGNGYSQTSMTPMGETLERKHGYTSRHGPGGRLLELSNINTTPVGSKYPPVQGVEWTTGNGYSQSSMTPMGETLEGKHGDTSRHGSGDWLLPAENQFLNSYRNPLGSFSSLIKSTETGINSKEGDSSNKLWTEALGDLEFEPGWNPFPSTGSSHIGYHPEQSSIVHKYPSEPNMELESNLGGTKGSSIASHLGAEESGSNGLATVSTSNIELEHLKSGDNLYDMMAPGMVTARDAKDKTPPPEFMGTASNKTDDTGMKQLTEVQGFTGTDFALQVITVQAGENIWEKVMTLSWSGVRALCILSANGSVSSVTLSGGASSVSYQGLFEIVSLSGSFVPSESCGQCTRTGGLSVLLACPGQTVIGGAVSGQLTAASAVEVTVGSFLLAGEEQTKDY